MSCASGLLHSRPHRARWWRRPGAGASLALALTVVGCGLDASLEEATPVAGGAAGYGGEVIPTAGAGGAAGKAGGGQGGAVSYKLDGYFDLHFVTVATQQQVGPSDVAPPSQDIPLRLDLPEEPTKGDWVATLTPRWGQPAQFSVTATSEGLVLKGSTSLGAVVDGRRVNDVWQSFVLETKGSKLTGRVSATGQENVSSLEGAWEGKLSGVGELRPDQTVPEGKAMVSGVTGKGGSLLPWEPLEVKFAEPLKAVEAKERLSFSTSAGVVQMSWFPPKDAGDTVSSLFGYRRSWDTPAADSALQLQDGYRDPALNPGQGSLQGVPTLEVPASGGKSASWSDGKHVSWGQVSLVDSKACEGKACLAIGPFDAASCGVAPTGVAVRLPPAPAGAHLRLRLRVLQSVPSVLEGNEPSGPALLSVQVVRPGKEASVSPVGALAILDPSGDEELPFASAWTTRLVPLPEGEGDVGVTLQAGDLGATKACSDMISKKGAAQARVVVGGLSLDMP